MHHKLTISTCMIFYREITIYKKPYRNIIIGTMIPVHIDTNYWVYIEFTI